MRHVYFNYGSYKFDLLLTGRYTVVVGDTGSGKTLLYNKLMKYRKAPNLGKVDGCNGIRAISDGVDVLSSSSEVIVIDEDVIFDKEFGELQLDKYDHKYILLCRDLPAKIPYGVYNVCELKGSDTKYALVQTKIRPLLRRAVVPPKVILCEDSHSGYYATCAAYAGEGYDTQHADGKDNIPDKMAGCGYVLADLCGLGNTLYYILEQLTEYPNVQVCDIISFESEVLRFYNRDVETLLYYGFSWNVEELFEVELKLLLQSTDNVGYNKGNEGAVRSLVTGHNAHEHKGLEELSPMRKWWHPDIPHIK